ncbi:pre-mRNA-splicing factor [Actinomyces sp. 432]|uniref:pre-mRNA-splicing factor n=1 Tax=Actinomyces sp. 432 TaxID=2057798 RepID=UPI00137455CC|nr:pre-mRNA-splicing factor [Actinomyces sp. 432]QHO91570.1 pre-mRNA-splicing factor [Actinomyces sp. 432]
MIHGFFTDVSRWNRSTTGFTRNDALLIAYCAAVWIVLVRLAMGHLLGAMTHSPLRMAALWCMAGYSAWLALPVVQIFTPWESARRLLRTAIHGVSILAGAGSLGFLSGVWSITRAPALAQDYFWEITFPGGALILLGLVGLAFSSAALRHSRNNIPMDQPASGERSID